MLYLYQSNRLETLFELLLAVVRQPLSSPFTQEVVVVQSKGMGRWITLKLAEKTGVCSNMNFQLPATFIWQLFRSLDPALPARSGFTPDVMAWRIADILADDAFLMQHPALAAYVAGQDPVRRFELSDKIADTFDQYLMYRPDWIEAWESGRKLGLGEDEHWQQPLWLRLANENLAPHRVRMLDNLFAALKRGERPDHLPERVVLFGMSAMPPVYVEILHRLSDYLDVALFVLNPCEVPWGHIGKQSATKPQLDLLLGESGPAGPEDWYVDVDHPLLASLGRQGRDFMDLLIERHSAELTDLFTPADGTTVLAQVQNDLLALQVPNGSFAPDDADDSLQVHVCHSPMRELEVLHDQLLRLFDRYPDLQPADVAVLMPNIETYAPLIDAVFAEREGVPYIPYGIADRALNSEQPLVQVVSQILALVDSRFEVNEVLALLESEPLARRFGLAAHDLPVLREWVIEAGIRWGRDATHKRQLGLPEDDAHTWRQGLDRMLLGVALPVQLAGSVLPLWQDTLPCEVAEGSRASMLAGLTKLLDALFDLTGTMQHATDAATWVQRLHALLEDFFLPDTDDEAALQPVRDCFTRLREDTELARFAGQIPLAWVRRWLEQGWKQAYGSTGFLSGGVTFCAMVPMRSLPFQVLCLLGLNDGDFPRQLQPHSFDLMHRHYRRGDRYRRFDDRYLFLEAILSARHTLYMSYVGTSIRDGSVLPPSPLLAECLDVVRQTCQPATDWLNGLVIHHPLQPFDSRYFSADERIVSYAAPFARAGEIAGQGQLVSHLWMQQPLPTVELPPHQLMDWLSCFRNPSRYLLQKRMGVRLGLDEPQAEQVEPFALDWVSRQSVREGMAVARQYAWQTGKDDERLVKASGVLPAGALGHALFDQEKTALAGFLSQLGQLPPALPDRLPIEIELASGRLTGLLGGLHDVRLTREGLWGAKADKLRPWHEFALWVQHVVLCAAKPAGIALQSQWLALSDDDKTQCLQFAVVEQPLEVLNELANAFHFAACYPLPFFIKSSHAWLSAEQIEHDGLKAAHQAWDVPANRHNAFHRGECENPYYETVYRGQDPLDEEFTHWAQTLLTQMFAHRQITTVKAGGDA
ncbi:exodeoxyribonuclease V subunit gamma [Leeia oryzae]|uniref:exodeoxyribonuclease V subunit gamma n=1 Tax=Leeia oryzae TaxID=356662 RepID=UPI0003606854|nr:exodeoxyribonuclease V subunit gamma [Leeia oryzae]